MENYLVFTYYGLDEIVRDIITFCVDNPMGLDFSDKLSLSYRKLEFGFGYVSVIVNTNDYATICDFQLIAELLRGVENE